jgi:hypothetical protein
LGPGFGSDADAWRIAGAARTIAQTGHYVASRFPGAPVVELSDSLLLRLGPWALPLASAIWGAIACVAFYVALCRLGARGCFWAALALAFTPVFWIHTTDAMDYSWALGLALVSFALAVHARPTLAGVALGLAIGCRLPTALLIVPIAVLLEGRNDPRFVLATILFGALALAPSFLTYGTRFLSGYEFGRVPWIYVVKGATRDVWGVIGTIAIAVAVLIALFRVRRVPRRELAAVISAVVLTGLIYLRLPHDGAYLLPMVPFVLLFLTRALAKPGAVALASLLLLSALFVNISQTDIHALRTRGGARPPFRPFLRPFIGGPELEWGKGPLLVERDKRIDLLQTRDLVLQRAKGRPTTAVVMVYELLPAIEWEARDAAGPKFVHLLTPASLEIAKQDGQPVFATEDAWDAEWQVHRVHPEQFGVQLLSAEPISF